jgi:hypothetical protein
MGSYDIAQVCPNGHVANDSTQRDPEFNMEFCDKCGEDRGRTSDYYFQLCPVRGTTQLNCESDEMMYVRYFSIHSKLQFLSPYHLLKPLFFTLNTEGDEKW